MLRASRVQIRLALAGLVVLLSATTLAQGPAGVNPATSALNGFDEFVEAAMTSWRVPGLALAVVKDGKVVLAKGYGLRNAQAKLPVTADTLFAIGSSTKAFTTMALGMLVEEGKLRGTNQSRSICRRLRCTTTSRPLG